MLNLHDPSIQAVKDLATRVAFLFREGLWGDAENVLHDLIAIIERHRRRESRIDRLVKKLNKQCRCTEVTRLTSLLAQQEKSK